MQKYYVSCIDDLTLYSPCAYPIDDSCNQLYKRDYYLDELFDPATPVPGWGNEIKLTDVPSLICLQCFFLLLVQIRYSSTRVRRNEVATATTAGFKMLFIIPTTMQVHKTNR